MKLDLDKQVNVKGVFLLTPEGTHHSALSNKEKSLGELIIIRQKMKADADRRADLVKAVDQLIENNT